MPKKKKTPAEILRELEKNLQERYERWLHIRKEGCSDPYWADGTNLYLVRNHCLYYRCQIAELCDTYGFSYPKSYLRTLPPELPMDFMTKPRQLVIEEASAISSISNQFSQINSRYPWLIAPVRFYIALLFAENFSISYLQIRFVLCMVYSRYNNP